MTLKVKKWNRDRFFEELRSSVENVMRGLSQKEEYDWWDGDKVGFKIYREDGVVVVKIK